MRTRFRFTKEESMDILSEWPLLVVSFLLIVIFWLAGGFEAL